MIVAYLILIAVIGIEFIGLSSLRPLVLPLSVLLTLYVGFVYRTSEFLRPTQIKLLILFIFLTAFALVHGFVQSNAIEPIKQQVGYVFWTFCAFFLLDRERRINLFLMALVAVMVFLTVINLDKFQGVRAGAFQAGFFLGDGNDFGWGLNVMFPFALYGIVRFKGIWRLACIGAVALIVLGIVGTQSRGASLALVAGLGYLWLMVIRSKLKGVLIVTVILGSVATFAPGEYVQRMVSIANYEEDSSAMGRIHAWGEAIEMAVDHPLLGVGAGSFNSAYGRVYRDPDDPVRWISTHSIYFKVLAEYGFTGIFVFLGILWANFRCNLQTRALIIANAGSTKVNRLLPDMLNMSLVAYAAAGAFLTGVSYPYLFLITAIVLAVHNLVRRQVDEAQTSEAVEIPGADRVGGVRRPNPVDPAR